MMTKLYIIFILLLLLLSCSDRNPQNPFDPNSYYQTTPMQGELHIFQLTDSHVTLGWQLNSSIKGNYIIKRKINLDNDYVILDSININSSFYNDTELLTTNTYYYQLIGANGNVQTEPISNSINPAFAEITDFNIQQENIFTTILSWQHDCNYEEGYIIEKMETGKRESEKRRKGERKKGKEKKENTDDFVQIANLSANETSFTDTTLLLNHSYEYRIKAYTTFNESGYKNNDVIILFPAPDNCVISQDDVHTFSLIWNDNSKGEQGFNIERKIDNGDYILIHTNAENDTTYIDDINTREQFETVYYKIYAFYEDIYSDSLIGSCSINFPAPTNLQYQQLTISSIQLTWDDNSNGEEGFKIDKKVGTNAWQNEFSSVDENIEEWKDENAEINEILQYRVYAFSGNNNSSSIETGEIDNSIPVPENLSYTIIDICSIELHWQYNTVGIDSFVIARKEGEDNWDNNFASVPCYEFQWIDSTLEPDEIYYYKIRAKYDYCYSYYSNQISYNLFELCVVPAGDYTYGNNNIIQNIPYDYFIMKYEVTNQQYIDYLEEAYAAGDIWIEDVYVVGYYEGDSLWPAGDYNFYNLGTPYIPSYNYAQISYYGNSFVINVPSGFNQGDFDNHPVVEITWFGALAFAEHYGFELPTEQEWEKAARGDTGYDYPWGNSIDESRANYHNSGDPFDNGTTPIGYYNGQNYNGFQTTDSPSETYGVYDMAGNVWDWCDSFYGGINPSYRVRRGGSWLSNTTNLLSFYRSCNLPSDGSYNVGFRCLWNP